MQQFCKLWKTLAKCRAALAWRRPGVQVPSGTLSFSVDLQVKREEQEMVPACSSALVQQPSGTTGSCGQSQTSFAPNSLRVHALLRRVRSCEPLRRLRLRTSFSCVGAVCLYPMLSLSSQQMKMNCCENRAWPFVTSFSPLHIYVAPQHLVLTSIHRSGPTSCFRPLRYGAMQHLVFRLRRIPLPRTRVNNGYSSRRIMQGLLTSGPGPKLTVTRQRGRGREARPARGAHEE